MSRRCERTSTALTSDKCHEEWGEIFGGEGMASALIDRLVHHCRIIDRLRRTIDMRLVKLCGEPHLLTQTNYRDEWAVKHLTSS